jgi:hypothetical protein
MRPWLAGGRKPGNCMGSLCSPGRKSGSHTMLRVAGRI